MAAETMTTTDADAIDTAWRIHTQLADWTGKVDTKASFAMSIESAVLAVVIATSGGDELLGDFSGLERIPYWLGIVLLATGIVAAMLAVIPQMGRSNTAVESEDNIVYFGHLRHWKPERLTSRLKEADILPMLARQLTIMSRIAWRKHRRLQLSFAAAMIGTLLLVIAGVIHA